MAGQIKLCEESYIDFFALAWKQLEPNTKLKINWHHEYIADLLQKEVFRITNKIPKDKDFIFNVPPRSGKSSLITIFYPVWAWIVNPHLRFITLSFGGDLAQKHSLFSKILIESVWFQERFSDRFSISDKQDTKSFYLTDKFGFRKAAGTGGQVTGEGCNILIVDDAINPKKARSAVERETVLDLWRTSFHNRINDKEIDVRMIVGQRLHEDDLPGYLLSHEPEHFKHICIPAETEGEIKPAYLEEKYKKGLFFPAMFSREVLAEEKKTLGAVGYAGQYLQMPTPNVGSIVPVNDFQIVEMEVVQQRMREYYELKKKKINNDAELVPTWHDYADTANGLEDGDRSAIGAYCVIGADWFIREVAAVNLELFDLCDFFNQFCLRNGYTTKSALVIEGLANGKAVISAMKRRHKINVREDQRPGIIGKLSKEERMLSHKEVILSKRIHLIKGAWNDAFIHECRMFPKGKYKDQVDVLEGMIRNGSRAAMGGVVGF